LLATPTQQAENPSALLLSEGFSAFAAFVSGLCQKLNCCAATNQFLTGRLLRY
jgi:hypothetical protein